jgi:MFS transporter, SET family, sugar efflux transporter
MTTSAAAVRGTVFLPLALAVLLLGIADSMVGSYLVLFAADVAGLEPVQVGIFTSAPALGGLVVGWRLGRRFDHRPTRSYAVAVTALGAVGLALMTATTSFPVLVVLAVTLLGALTAAFPQLFAIARACLGDGAAGRRSAPLLRSAWSLAWAIGPLIGAAVLTRTGFTAVLWTAAGVLAGTSTLVALAVPAPQPAGQPHVAGRPDGSASGSTVRAVALYTAAIALFFTAMYAGSLALPLYVTRGLHERASAVGVLFSVCAVVEVVAALALAAVPATFSQGRLILAAMGTFVLSFVLTVLAHGLALVVIGQVARGIAIAVVGAAGIRFFQDLLAPANGRATTLFANASTAGSLIAGVLAGLTIEAFGYTTTLVLCAAAAGAAAATFVAGMLSRAVPVRRPPDGRPPDCDRDPRSARSRASVAGRCSVHSAHHRRSDRESSCRVPYPSGPELCGGRLDATIRSRWPPSATTSPGCTGARFRRRQPLSRVPLVEPRSTSIH